MRVIVDISQVILMFFSLISKSHPPALLREYALLWRSPLTLPDFGVPTTPHIPGLYGMELCAGAPLSPHPTCVNWILQTGFRRWQLAAPLQSPEALPELPRARCEEADLSLLRRAVPRDVSRASSPALIHHLQLAGHTWAAGTGRSRQLPWPDERRESKSKVMTKAR